jgi:hypothetical protein
VLAVLLDGAAWARRRTVGDRDGLPVDVLREMLDWPAVERVWLPSWLGDPDAVLDRLVAAVAATPPPARGSGRHRPERRPAPAPRSPGLAGPPAGKPQLAVVPGVPAAASGTVGAGDLRPVRSPSPATAGSPARSTAAPLPSSPMPATTSSPEPEPVSPPRLTLVPPPAPDVEVASAPTEAPAVPEATVPEPTVPEPATTEPTVTEPAAGAAPAPARRGRGRHAAPEPLAGERPFVAWTPKPAGEKKVLDSLSDAKAARTVRRVLLAGVRTEGPVHQDRLVRAAAAAFGLSRVSETRRQALLALLPEGSVVGEHVWPVGLDRATWTDFRRQAGSADRPLEQVAAEEVANAMVALCRADGMTREELYLRTLELFGHRRRTPTLLPHLDAAYALAASLGRLTEQPDGLVTS